jgi:hypothetical protein
MTDRLTRWEGRDENGQRAVLVNRDGPWPENYQEALRKLARYEDAEEPTFLPIVGKPMTDRELGEWLSQIIRTHAIPVQNEEEKDECKGLGWNPNQL